jgi:hypothetical protein
MRVMGSVKASVSLEELYYTKRRACSCSCSCAIRSSLKSIVSS